MSALEETLDHLRQALDELGLRWYVFGAQASNVYGTPRTTADIDITVEAPRDVRELEEALGVSDLVRIVDNWAEHTEFDTPQSLPKPDQH